MGIIRLLLAISVVIGHGGSTLFGLTLPGGIVSVETFYIISGFYMALILTEKYHSYSQFLRSRFLKLYPTYWIVLILTISLSIFSFVCYKNPLFLNNWLEYFHNLNVTTLFYLIFASLFLFGQDWIMFLGINSLGVLYFTTNFNYTNPKLYEFLFVPQAWSLGVEITFYLIAPILVKRKTKTIILLTTASFVLKAILYTRGLINDPWTYRFFPSELAFFLLGTLSYKIYCRIRKTDISKTILIIVYAVMFILTAFYQFIPKFDFICQALYKYLPTVCNDSFINSHFINYFITQHLYYLVAFITLPFTFMLFKTNKWDRNLGELSYPVYISHIFVLELLNLISQESGLQIITSKHFGVLLAFMTILFSVLLYVFITKPLEKIRYKPLTQNEYKLQ